MYHCTHCNLVIKTSIQSQMKMIHTIETRFFLLYSLPFIDVIRFFITLIKKTGKNAYTKEVSKTSVIQITLYFEGRGAVLIRYLIFFELMQNNPENVGLLIAPVQGLLIYIFFNITC